MGSLLFNCQVSIQNILFAAGNVKKRNLCIFYLWKYLDKRSATVAAIKDYSSMQFIISHTAEEIKAERDRMSSTGSPRWDGMPHAHNPQAGEERSSAYNKKNRALSHLVILLFGKA